MVQEVLLRLVDSISRGSFSSKKGNHEAFAWGIALNVQREAQRSRMKIADDHELETVPAPTNEPTDDISALKRAVELLSEPQRTILQMTLADLSIVHIADTLEMPEGSVKSHIHRAKEEIRKKFKKWRLL